MFTKRISGRTPTQAEILELEQVVVVERDAPTQVAEVGQSTIVVGEVVNDRGEPLVARRLQTIGELDSYYGGFRDWIGADADGWEGNLYAHVFPLRFPDLIVVPVDLEAGEVELSATLTRSLTVPAGTRVATAGGATFATLEDADFVGTGYSETKTVRVRHVSGGTSALISSITVVVDTAALDGETVTVHNSVACTAVDVDAAYLEAITACLDESSIAADGSILFACRHTEAVLTALEAHASDASEGGRGRFVVVSPPIGTSKTTAEGSAGVGAGNFRTDRLAYAWPGLRWLFAQWSSSAYTTTHADAWLACVIARTNPEESPGQTSGTLAPVVGVETGITLSRATYKSLKAAGIVAFNVARNGDRCFYSAVTTSLAAGKEPIEQRRTTDMITDSLAIYLLPYKDAPLTETRRNGAKDACESFLAGLEENERIAAHLVDVDSVNTPDDLALGIFYILVKVRRIAAAKAIVLLAQIGATVTISEQ